MRKHYYKYVNIQKGEYEIKIKIEERHDLYVYFELNGEAVKGVRIKKVADNKLFFEKEITLNRDGKKISFAGLNLTDEQVEEIEKTKIDLEEEKENDIRIEREELLNGTRELEISGDVFEGYVAHGQTAQILVENGCAQWLDGYGYVVDSKFANAKIEQILNHGEELRKVREEKEKEFEEKAAKEKEILKKVDDHKVTEELTADEIGTVKVYIHTFKINGKIIEITEKNLFDVGRVITPFKNLTDDEKICYEIVEKFGYTDNSVRI